MSLPENISKIVADEAKAKLVAQCRLDAAFKLFEAAAISGDSLEVERQRNVIHSLQDVILDSMQIVYDSIARSSNG